MLPDRRVKYRLLKYVQIDGLEQRSVAPGEHVMLNLKPGVYSIKIAGACRNGGEWHPLPEESTIIPGSPGWPKEVRTFKVTIEPGKANVLPFSLGCALNRYAGQFSLVGGIVTREINNKYVVFKTKNVSGQ